MHDNFFAERRRHDVVTIGKRRKDALGDSLSEWREETVGHHRHAPANDDNPLDHK